MKDCVMCIHEYQSPMSEICRTCSIAMKNYKEREQKPITNADRIRAMTDEELAAWIADHPVVSEYDENNPLHKAWLGWLKQEGE